MKLTPTQQLYLEALQNSPNGLSLEALLALKPARGLHNAANLVAAHIKDLRKKTGLDIRSIRGFGYKIMHPEI
jgi:DNA-binding response OmpR family regulator